MKPRGKDRVKEKKPEDVGVLGVMGRIGYLRESESGPLNWRTTFLRKENKQAKFKLEDIS